MSILIIYENFFNQVIAHEIGHNLGMEHDFGATTSTNKYASTGELCTGIGGYMDYRSNPTKWSACSVENYNTYYNSVSPWCLTACKLSVTNHEANLKK